MIQYDPFPYRITQYRKRNPEKVRAKSLCLFWDKIEKHEGGCWNWCGETIGKGYGRASYCGYDVLAHRLSFYLANGYLSELMVCHSCDNTRCVNPEHLFLGNAQDNRTDAVIKGRQAKGERCGNAKLKASEVAFIRSIPSGGILTQKDIAAFFCVSQSLISLIKNGERWND